MMRKRKEIPARIFHKLWDEAVKAESREGYLRKYATISTYGMKLSRYNLSDRDSFVLVEKIYELSHKAVRDIAQAAGLKKAGMGHLFCIPKRTLEEWYKNDSRCPSYIKLSMLKQLGQFDIGKDIHVESFNKTCKKESISKGTRVRSSKDVVDSIISARQQEDVHSDQQKNILNSIRTRHLLEETQYLKDRMEANRLRKEKQYRENGS